MQATWFRSTAKALVCGILISICSGLLENCLEASTIGSRYCGYLLIRRMAATSQRNDMAYPSWGIDAAFWIALSTLFWLATEKSELLKRRAGFRHTGLLLSIVLLVPLGLAMDFVHEFGHLLCGFAAGGSLTYMKVAYFELYPRPAVSPEFQLGIVIVTGLSTGPQYGLFQLGGSLTTNLVAWALGVTLLRTRLGYRARAAFGTLGVFGLLDLPLYVLFPQMGLQHWLYLGGDQPEPLIGATKMGVPVPAFYAATLTTTLGLTFLYSRCLREKATDWIASIPPETMQQHGIWIRRILPALIVLSLWLDGWFYPLVLLPLLYVLLVEKKSLGWLGFRTSELGRSALLGIVTPIVSGMVYYPVFLHYIPLIQRRPIGLYDVFTDIFWYPVYEEVAYRSFALAHFAKFDESRLSTRNLLANLSQSLLFVSVHHHHVTSGMPLLLAPVLMLGLLNGYLFLRTRNIYGCMLSHSTLNGFALLLSQASAAWL